VQCCVKNSQTSIVIVLFDFDFRELLICQCRSLLPNQAVNLVTAGFECVNPAKSGCGQILKTEIRYIPNTYCMQQLNMNELLFAHIRRYRTKFSAVRTKIVHRFCMFCLIFILKKMIFVNVQNVSPSQ